MMDEQTFLDNFGTITAAPDGVERVRELILLLAVTGGLVGQSPSDEPASEAIARAASELSGQTAIRGRSASNSRIPGRAALHVGSPADVGLPTGWEIAALSAVTRLESGHTPDRNIPAYWDGPFAWLGITDARRHRNEVVYETEQSISQSGIDNSATRLLPAGTVCLSRTASVGYVVVLGREMCTSQDFVNFVCTSAVRPRYLQLIFRAEGDGLRNFSKGAVHQTIYFPEVKAFHILLPPVAEQERILAKVAELMQLCDELEARQEARDHVTIRLRASSLDALTNAETDDDLHTAWSRIHTNWEALTDLPDSIDALRQTILQLAGRGKLVSQESKDHPALNLIDQIGNERHRLGLRSGMESAARPRFAIPATWAWTTFGFITDARLGKMLDNARNTGPYRPYLRNTNVQWFRFELDDVAELRLEDSEYEEYELHPGDLLICEGGEPGRAAVCDDAVAGLVFQKALHRARPLLGIEPWYLAFLLRSYSASGLLAPYLTGATIRHLTGRSLARLPVPLPPIDEQRRIVDRVWELMRRCDELEARLVSRRRSHEKLARTLTSAAAS